MSPRPSPPTTDKSSRAPPPFQFTLRQLLGAMAAICFASSLIYWFGPAALIFPFLLGCFVGFFYFAFTQRFAEAAVVALIATVITLIFLPAFMGARDCPRWAYCQNNMYNIALALQQYEINNGSFPPAYIADANGKPMHSWRVLILPYLEQKALYKQYRFDEPWDGPNNSQLHGELVRLYECPSDAHATRTETNYLAVTGPQTIWPGATTTKMSDIKDGPANTILLVEAHNSGIHWMEPRDLDFATMPMTVNSPNGLSISSVHLPTGFANVVFVEGRPQRIPNTTPSKSLRAALTISGGEKDKLPAVRLPR